MRCDGQPATFKFVQPTYPGDPKGQDDPTPAGLTRRAVQHPIPMWTWSLVWRRGESNPLVHAVIDAFTVGIDVSSLTEAGTWLPADDPHR